jgi:hypothetical protein
LVLTKKKKGIRVSAVLNVFEGSLTGSAQKLREVKENTGTSKEGNKRPKEPSPTKAGK